MKRIICLAAFSISISLLQAQTSDLTSRYIKVTEKPSEGILSVMGKNYKWGFVDAKTGIEIVAPKYEVIQDFKEGFAGVGIKDKFGFIDKTGKEVIPLIYDDSKNMFRDGIAAVNKGATRTMGMGLSHGVWGFIDKTGKEVISFRYEDVNAFYDESIAVKIDGHWGFIDKAGKLTVPAIYNEVHNFSENYATGRRVTRPSEKDVDAIKAGNYDMTEGWTFFDRTGTEIIKPQYNHAGTFKDGLLGVTILPKQFQPEKYGFIDKTGKVVIPITLDGAYDFGNGLAPVYSREKGKWGYINTKGELVIPYKYEYAYSFKNGAAIVKHDDVYYSIGTEGKETKAAGY